MTKKMISQDKPKLARRQFLVGAGVGVAAAGAAAPMAAACTCSRNAERSLRPSLAWLYHTR